MTILSSSKWLFRALYWPGQVCTIHSYLYLSRAEHRTVQFVGFMSTHIAANLNTKNASKTRKVLPNLSILKFCSVISCGVGWSHLGLGLLFGNQTNKEKHILTSIISFFKSTFPLYFGYRNLSHKMHRFVSTKGQGFTWTGLSWFPILQHQCASHIAVFGFSPIRSPKWQGNMPSCGVGAPFGLALRALRSHASLTEEQWFQTSGHEHSFKNFSGNLVGFLSHSCSDASAKYSKLYIWCKTFHGCVQRRRLQFPLSFASCLCIRFCTP